MLPSRVHGTKFAMLDGLPLQVLASLCKRLLASWNDCEYNLFFVL